MRTRLKALSKNPFLQGGVFLTATNFITGFLNYFFNILAGRALGPAGYGEITALFSYLYIFSVPLAIVTNLMIQKIGSTSQDKVAYTHAIEVWFIQKIKRWWFLFILCGVLIPFIPQLTNLNPIAGYALIPFIALSFLSAVYDGAFQGLHLFLWFSFISVCVVILKLTGAVLAISGFPGLEMILLFLILSIIFKIFLSKHIFQGMIKKTNTSETIIFPARALDILKENHLWITAISLLSITLLNNIDVIFVKKFFTAEEAGLYGSWSLFAKIIFYFISPLLSIGFIFFSSKEHENQHKRIFIGSLIFLVVMGIGSYIFYTFFGSFLILSFFGKQYEAIIPILSSASIFGILFVAILYINNFFLTQKSKLALLLPCSIPIYIIALFFIPKNLDAIIQLNIIFSSFFILICVVASIKTFSYNKSNGRKTT